MVHVFVFSGCLLHADCHSASTTQCHPWSRAQPVIQASLIAATGPSTSKTLLPGLGVLEVGRPERDLKPQSSRKPVSLKPQLKSFPALLRSPCKRGLPGMPRPSGP